MVGLEAPRLITPAKKLINLLVVRRTDPLAHVDADQAECVIRQSWMIAFSLRLARFQTNVGRRG
jgi:hypothetical protein